MDVIFNQLRDSAFPPTYSTMSSACMDFRSPESRIIVGGELAKIPLGISWSTTNPFSFIKLFDRSSLAAQGLEIKAGVIDSDYTGEIILLIKNTTDSSITILAGDKVCQGAILERVNVSRYAWSKEGEFFEQYNPVSVEVRKGGFGSTGR